MIEMFQVDTHTQTHTQSRARGGRGEDYVVSMVTVVLVVSVKDIRSGKAPLVVGGRGRGGLKVSDKERIKEERRDKTKMQM